MNPEAPRKLTFEQEDKNEVRAEIAEGMVNQGARIEVGDNSEILIYATEGQKSDARTEMESALASKEKYKDAVGKTVRITIDHRDSKYINGTEIVLERISEDGTEMFFKRGDSPTTIRVATKLIKNIETV